MGVVVWKMCCPAHPENEVISGMGGVVQLRDTMWARSGPSLPVQLPSHCGAVRL